MSAAAVPAAAVDRPANANEECVGPASEQAGKASSCDGCPNQAACAAGEGRKVDPAVAEVAERLSGVKHKILVLSGKGGVGKSTVSAQLSWTLASRGFQVGILDVDICGPSVPRMMGVESEEVRKSNYGWSPVYATENLSVMSVAFMLSDRSDAIIWRGPRKTGLIKQFLTDVDWGDMDFLIIDAPPGTSDEHITIASYLTKAGVDGALIVTTPQEIALLDVRKEISFCNKVGVPVLGVVENMSGFVCPTCSTCSHIFPAVTGGAAKMAADMKVPFLGSIPLDPNLLQACEKGVCFVEKFPQSSAVQPLQAVVQKLLASTPAIAATEAALDPSAATSAAATGAPAPPAPSSFALVISVDAALLLAVSADRVMSVPVDLSPALAALPVTVLHTGAVPAHICMRGRSFKVLGPDCVFKAPSGEMVHGVDVSRMRAHDPAGGKGGDIVIPLPNSSISITLQEFTPVSMDTA